MTRVLVMQCTSLSEGDLRARHVRCRGARRALGWASGTGAALFWGVVFRSKQVFSFLDFPFLSFISLSLSWVSVWPIYKCWFAEGLTVSPKRSLPPVASWCLCTSCPTNGRDTNSCHLASSLHIIPLLSILHCVSNLLGSFYEYISNIFWCCVTFQT